MSHYSDFCHHQSVLSFLDVHTKGVIKYVACGRWHFPDLVAMISPIPLLAMWHWPYSHRVVGSVPLPLDSEWTLWQPWLKEYGGNDAIWLLSRSQKCHARALLGHSLMEPSHHARRKLKQPVEKLIWEESQHWLSSRPTASANLAAMWVVHLEGGFLCPSWATHRWLVEQRQAIPHHVLPKLPLVSRLNKCFCFTPLSRQWFIIQQQILEVWSIKRFLAEQWCSNKSFTLIYNERLNTNWLKEKKERRKV